ncbi:MAG: prepilin-type N-terminal cleavage/methylation domain-containing protein, partial [Candidatus Omnitrophica bacterium]|nr:prepilin-type N-terminal cleavage/methylation domain-containing protein [Candidatus Omnitrophota bacterium]
MRRSLHSFTLIELLIVVAIIGILAAIAVPNFLNAQVRAKIAHVESDFKALQTALESYYVDNNTYPVDSDNSWQIGLIMLTTPVSYITAFPREPFVRTDQAYIAGAGDSSSAPFYEMGTDTTWERRSPNPNQRRGGTWSLTSTGPDGEDSTGGQLDWPWGTNWYDFDASNGLHSWGDIFWMGGDYMHGTWTRNGIPN